MDCEMAVVGSIGNCQNISRPFFDCALSKYSSVLSALRFKPVQAAPLRVYFYTHINEMGLKNRIIVFVLQKGLKKIAQSKQVQPWPA